MSKKYTTDEIHVGGHNLNAPMMVTLNSLANAGLHSNAGYLTNLPSHNHDDRYYTETQSDNKYVSEGGTTFNGAYPFYFRTGARSAYSHPNITYTGSNSSLFVGGDVRAPIFYDSNNTSYYLNPAGTSKLDVVNATLVNDTRSANPGGNSVTRVIAPDGGMGSWDGSNTGAIKIRLPWKALDMMWSMNVEIYNYATSTMEEYSIGNYSYSNGGYNSSAIYKGASNSTPKTVRFGNDGTKDCVWIGEVGSSWSYPVVTIKDISGGFRRATPANMQSGYELSIVTSFSTVQTTIDPGIKSGTVRASTDMRAPIFYDSNDTNYHLNPASTSNLNGLTVNGTISGNISGNASTATTAGNASTATTAADSNLLNGIDSSSFLRSDANDSFSGQITMGTQKALIAGDHGRGVYGAYSSTRLQHLWSMGTAYNLHPRGTTSGNMYGIAWSHKNRGTIGGANNLASHGMLILESGLWKGAWGGGSLRTPSDVRAPIYFDLDNTGYYLNPASTSNLNGLRLNGDLDMKAQTGTWITSDIMSDAIGWNTNYGVYIGSNVGGSHYLRGNGTFTTGGSTYNLWHAGNDGSGSGLDADLLDGQQPSQSGGGNRIAQYSSNGYLYNNSWIHPANGTGLFYDAGVHFYEAGNYMYSNTSLQAANDMRAPVFYDSSDTNYYLNPNGHSKLSTLEIATSTNIGANYAYKDVYVGGDADTYYPVRIGGSGGYGFHNYSVSRRYNWNAPNTWYTASHKGGLTFTFQWSSDTAWGGNHKSIRVTEFKESYSTMLGGITLPVTGGVMVWLRGGNALYRIHTPKGSSTTVTVELNGYTASNGSFYGTRTSPVPSEWESRWPIRGDSDSAHVTNGYIDSVLTAGASVISPEFYDLNNTSYYLNPAGTSNLNSLNVATINRNPVVTLSGDVTGAATMTNLGSININTSVVNGYINSTEPNEPFNPFAGQKFHDGVLTNALVGRHDRFVVTIDGTTEAGASYKLSNQNFEEYNQNRLFGTSAGETKVFNINVQSLATGSPRSSGITYSAGFFDINFYSSPFPASWSARVKNRDGNWTAVSSLTKIGNSKLRGVIPISNWLTDIEFTLTARTSAPFVTSNITYGISEFELFFSRMAASQGGNISSIGGYLGGTITTASGTTSTNWNTAYTHSQAAHAPSNAEANVQSDWNAASGDAHILNKPTIPSGSSIIDWTADQGATNIHSGNYTDTNTHRAISSTPANGATTTSISSDWAFDNVKTSVPTGALFTDTNDTYASSDFTHDDLTGFVAKEHLDWTADQGSNNIHANNYTNTNTWRGIDDTPVNGATAESISSNWAFDNVKTAVPAGAVFTDTNTTNLTAQHFANGVDILSSTGTTALINPATTALAGVVTAGNQSFSGNKSFHGDVLAPIFYDSNDTNYYVNPRSTSRFSLIDTNDIEVTGQAFFTDECHIASGGQILLDAASNGMYVNSDITFNSGKYIKYSTTHHFTPRDTSGNMHLKATAGGMYFDSPFHLFRDTANYAQTFRVDAGIGTASASLRAPIFYDSNNTGYYLNPAAGSELNAVTLKNSTLPFKIKVNSGYKSWATHIGSNSSYIIVPSTANGNETWSWSNALDVSTGGVCVANAFNLRSDERLKENIVPLPEKSIDVEWKSFNKIGDDTKRSGVIAQELEENHPEFVTTDEKGFKSVNYIDLLVAKIAELETRIKQLENN